MFNKTSGAFINNFSRQTRPANIVQDGESHFLFTTRDTVFRAAIDGSSTEAIVSAGLGGLSFICARPTYSALLARCALICFTKKSRP